MSPKKLAARLIRCAIVRRMINPPPPEPSPFRFSWIALVLVALTSCLLGGCASMGGGGETSNYHVAAYEPASHSDVHVYVSLDARMVYVMEGDKALLVTPCSIGVPGNPTPTGEFRVSDKNPTKRSGEYGFWTNGSDTYAGSSGSGRSGYHYVGYPMAYWVGFAPGFGFHEGYVWPVPRSHGCLRLHKNAVVKFYHLVDIGTPVTIRNSLPFDDTLGRTALHPSDYKDPDPPSSFMISPEYFDMSRDSELLPNSQAPSAK
jgi:hypothetical protein